jgi:hypothetical protein
VHVVTPSTRGLRWRLQWPQESSRGGLFKALTGALVPVTKRFNRNSSEYFAHSYSLALTIRYRRFALIAPGLPLPRKPIYPAVASTVTMASMQCAKIRSFRAGSILSARRQGAPAALAMLQTKASRRDHEDVTTPAPRKLLRDASKCAGAFALAVILVRPCTRESRIPREIYLQCVYMTYGTVSHCSHRWQAFFSCLLS